VPRLLWWAMAQQATGQSHYGAYNGTHGDAQALAVLEP
jgi:hypothetical protein